MKWFLFPFIVYRPINKYNYACTKWQICCSHVSFLWSSLIFSGKKMRFKSSSILKHPYQEIDFLHLYLVKHTFNLQCTKGFTFVFLQNVPQWWILFWFLHILLRLCVDIYEPGKDMVMPRGDKQQCIFTGDEIETVIKSVCTE